MTVASNWRSPTQGYLHHLNCPGFAWEFLRRNPAYQADYEAIVRGDASDAGTGGAASEALVRRWGCRFAVDPRLRADQAVVFWRPEALPTIVFWESAPASFSSAWRLDIAQLGASAAEWQSADARQLIIRNEVGKLGLWLRDPSQEQPLAVVLPIDEDLPVRVEAALRFWAPIAARATDDGQLALARQRRDRLAIMLRALDGHLSEAPYRGIAEGLFGARRVRSEFWKTSSLRDQIIRLVKAGVALMCAGYRRLLRGR